MQRIVAVVAGGGAGRPGPPADTCVAGRDGGRRMFIVDGCRRIHHDGIQGVEQAEIPHRAHRRERPVQTGLVAATGSADQPFPHRPADQFRCQPVQRRAIAFGQDLRVPGESQHRGQLAQLTEYRRVVGQPEGLFGSLEQTADLADGDPHLMHRIIGIGAHRAVDLQQVGDL